MAGRSEDPDLATKMLACPECGAAVAPGRYACAECGAMLAAVGTLPRSWPVLDGASSEIAATPGEVVANELVTTVPPAAVEEPRSSAKRARRQKAEPGAIAPAMGAESPAGTGAAESPAVASSRGPASRAPATVPPEDGLVAAERPRAIPEPPLWVRLAAPPEPAAPARPRVPSRQPGQRAARRDDLSSPPATAVAPLVAPRQALPKATAAIDASRAEVDDASRVRSEPQWPTSRPETPRGRGLVERAASHPATTLPTPGWPPPDERQLPPTPAIRTPAGAYLAPSAVLPPLDAPLASRNGHGPAGRDQGHGPSRPVERRSRPSLADSLDSMGITADMPRRLVGGGAAMAILGFLLPWVNAFGGGGALINDYLSYWGLAGPGHWLVAAALLALVAVAFAEQTFAQLRVGAIAVATAALLVGLLWTYLFGVPGKSVGVWIVLAGAALIAIGGALDLRRRHGPGAPAV